MAKRPLAEPKGANSFNKEMASMELASGTAPWHTR